MSGLFGAVEGSVTLVYLSGDLSESREKIIVSAVARIENVTVKLYHAGKRVAEKLDADHNGKYSRQTLALFCVFRSHKHTEYRKECKCRDYREPYRLEGKKLGIGFNVGFELMLLADRHEKEDKRADSENEFFAYAAQISESLVSQNQHNEAEHKAVAVVKPVGGLEAMPDKVER